MAISARLVNGVQGSAHAINKAGSLRMQSYRLLAAIPLNENDQKLLDEMTATVFSPELQNAARRDGQERQLKALQQYWQLALAPGMQRAIRRRSPRMSPTLSIVSTSWSPLSTTPPSSVSNGWSGSIASWPSAWRCC
jgi:nitrate/nitrite-specific signal transduction histidine kinase